MMADLPKPERRKKATFSQVNAILRLQNGVCTMCPAILADVSDPDVVYIKAPFDVDHVQPLDMLGTNAADNLQCLCVPCHKLKTAIDIATIAKGRRLRGETGQLKRRKERDKPLIQSRNSFQKKLLPRSEDLPSRQPDKVFSAWPKGRKLQSRGFGRAKP